MLAVFVEVFVHTPLELCVTPKDLEITLDSAGEPAL